MQTALLTEIQYESCLQLFLLVFLTEINIISVANTWWPALTSFFSIAKYYPFRMQLPQICAFKNRIFLEKDYVDLEEANQLLKPNILKYLRTLGNFCSIILRYLSMVELAAYNWVAFLLVLIISGLVVIFFLFLSFLWVERQKPSSRSVRKKNRYVLLMREIFSLSWMVGSKLWIRKRSCNSTRVHINVTQRCKRAYKKLDAVVKQSSIVVANFLLMPIFTAKTKSGQTLHNIVGFSFIITNYIITHVWKWEHPLYYWHDELTFGPRRYNADEHYYSRIRLIVGLVCFWLMNLTFLLQLILCRASFWLCHRQQDRRRARGLQICQECLVFRKRFCSYRPCWLCEWAWCDRNRTEIAVSESTEKKSTEPLYPVPFLELPLHNQQSVVILRMLASFARDNDDDFLLCDNHARLLKLRPLEQRTEECVMAGIGMRSTIVRGQMIIELFRDSENVFVLNNLPVSMHWFLRKLYSQEFLQTQLPYQLFYKSRLYDYGIRDKKRQTAYWSELRRLRNAHSHCGMECKLNRTQDFSNDMIFVLKPDRYASIQWTMNKTDGGENVSPDPAEYQYFNNAHVLLLDSVDYWDDRREPVRKCPFSEARGSDFQKRWKRNRPVGCVTGYGVTRTARISQLTRQVSKYLENHYSQFPFCNHICTIDSLQ
ncbi:uncharacterized protein LOC129592818 isoform X2 [Paramacrobiotus metropolitanus]|nr:uncharacterized protein LOC129592818 isoform X2 [Paramacrobiotus metropolitanus]